MKLKLGGLALGLLATTALALGALGPAGSVAAEPETDSARIGLAIATSDHTRQPTSLNRPEPSPVCIPAAMLHLGCYSIIACAAETIEARVSTVKAGLRAGFSLKEIAARHGVRANELKRGIVECERQLLWRLVEADELNRAQFFRLMNFLTTHIDRIINYHYDPHDAVLSEAVKDVAMTAAVRD